MIKGIRNTYYANPHFDDDKKLSIYQTFTTEKDIGRIENGVDFEKYLCQCLYWEKMLQDMQTDNDEGIVELEPSIPDDEMFSFDEHLPNEEENFDYLMKSELDL